jgi:DNA polymerase-1
MKALVDADTILYRVGFSKVDSAGGAVDVLRNYIGTILSSVSNDAIFYLTEKSPVRYRDRFASTFVYKESRAGAPSPRFISEMTGWMLDNLDTRIYSAEYGEADDAVSIQAWDMLREDNHNYIVCAVDKDLNQIPGNHYNYVTEKRSIISPVEADKFFFKQLLMGDRADSIPGLPKVGEVKSTLALKDASTPKEMWEIVLGMYSKHYEEMHEDDLSNILYERGNMLWMQRSEGQTWYPPIPE